MDVSELPEGLKKKHIAFTNFAKIWILLNILNIRENYNGSRLKSLMYRLSFWSATGLCSLVKRSFSVKFPSDSKISAKRNGMKLE